MQLKSKNTKKKKNPVIFHNLEGYDGHFIFRELNNFTNIDIDVIPKSTEKYMSIIINKNINFLDSLQFSKSTLEDLAANLEDAGFKYLLTEFPQDKLNLLKEKDAFPYEWIDDYRKFLYPNHPPKNAYYSRLKTNTRDGGDITEEKYEHPKNVWQTFNFKNVRDSHDHYLKKDVFFLAGLFERFIKTYLKYYNLDPCHYFSAPGLSWHAMLKMTNIELKKLVTQINIFIEEGMRGGICYAATKYSKANNEFCFDYDNTKPKTEIKYYEMNNLYGKAMMQYLPYKDFKWIKVSDKNIDIALNKKDKSLHGYILEVDMYCPDELDNQQNDFSMAPEKLKITKYVLSPEQIDMIKKHNLKVGITKKLTPNLYPKKNDIIYYRNLKYYLANCWQLTKVHRMLEIKQASWIKTYIDFNTETRMQATNEADKNFFKLWKI